MTRGRSGAQIAADVDLHAGRALLVECLFDSGALRICFAHHDITVGGNVYTATGAGVAVKELQEAVDGIEGFEVSLTGLDPAIEALTFGESYHGRVIRLLEQRWDHNDQRVGDPVVQSIGRMRLMQSNENAGDKTHTVTVQAEHYDAEFEQVHEVMFNDAEQRRRYPADDGFAYVAELVERVIARKPKT